MAGIRTGIELQDQFSSVILDFTNGMMQAISSATQFADTLNQNINTSALTDVQDEIQSVMNDMNNLNQTTGNIDMPDASGSNVQSFNEQVEQTQNLLQRVMNIQNEINTTGQRIDVVPDDVSVRLQTVSNSLLQMNEALAQIQNNPFNLPSEVVEQQLVSLQNRIRETTQEQLELNETLSNMDIERENPPPIIVPVEWQTDDLDIFTNTGIERFEQEVQSTNAMLEQLENTQDDIARQAAQTSILPDSAISDLAIITNRIAGIRQQIQQIENNPLDFGGNVNNQLERLRTQLSQATTQQNELNSAIDRMDVSGANTAYLNLSRTIGNTETYIRDNINEQANFNEEINTGTHNANGLMNAIKGAVGAYVTINGLKGALNLSDELVQTRSRLNMMNDGLQSTQDLTNMVYVAAQDARGSFGDMADVVARFGNNAKDAFSSSAEVVQFAGLIQKEMTIAGASTNEAANAMLQLSQALGSGTLRGDELNSIFEQSPNLIRGIADYIEQNDALLDQMAAGIKMKSEDLRGNVMGHIRDIASEGLISADIVKASVFSATEDINNQFNSMPMTWGQIWQSMQNTAIMAFQPILDRLNEMANSEMFQTFMNQAINAMAVVAGVILNVFTLVGNVANFIAENWSIIRPIILGVAGAIAVFAAYLAIVQIATTIVTAAQWLWNAAMAASPVTWIIAAIAILIGLVIAIANHVASLGGTATTAFGVITGGINVVIQFFKNLGLSVANIALGIGNAIAALGQNIMTAFHNAISSVQSWWYGLLSTAISVIEGICAALNKLPFVDFDYSGITAAADDYAAKSAAAANNKQSYTSISDAFNNGASTFNAFDKGWASDAYNAGAKWGDGVSKKVTNAVKGTATKIPKVSDYRNAVASPNSAASIANNTAQTAKNTGNTAKAAQKAAQSLDVSSENLKYIKDMAERDTINRFTTARINVKQTNHNTVKNNMDLDGINEYLRSDLEQRMAATAEGVH